MNGRLEAKNYQPANWVGTIAYNGGAAAPFTVAALDRFPTALLAALELALEAAVGGGVGFTVTGAFGEGGTGRVTITANTGLEFVIVWTSPNLEAQLGFSGGSTSSTGGTVTADRPMKGVWLPDAHYAGQGFHPSHVGHRVWPGHRQSVSPEGDVLTLQEGDGYRIQDGIHWDMVSSGRALDGFDNAVMSFQQWARETQRGGLDYFLPGSAVNFYSNATTNTLLGTYRILLPASDKLDEYEPDYPHWWRVVLEQLVEDA